LIVQISFVFKEIVYNEIIKLLVHHRLINKIFTFFNIEIFQRSHQLHLIQTINYLLLVYHRITMNRLELQNNHSFELLFN
jgi:hypothetical protein